MPDDPPDAPAAPAVVPRLSGLLVASLGLSVLTLLLPSVLGPFGPLLAGLLAFVGYRAVRKSSGILRGPVLAAVAMTTALVLFALMGWNMMRSFATAAAWTQIRAHVTRVESTLRTGTAEGAWALLSPRARAAGKEAAFLKELRDTMTRLGPLESMGNAEPAGGNWDLTADFERMSSARLYLPMDIAARFRGGPGRVHIEILVQRDDRTVTTEITELRVEAAAK